MKRRNMFVDKVRELTGYEYEVIGEYVNNKTKIHMKHKKCGYEWYVLPCNFTNRGSRCPVCARDRGSIKRRMGNDEFIKRVKSLVGEEYTFIELYETTHFPIKVKHNICNHVYRVRPSDFLQGYRCPPCSVEIRVKKRTLTHSEFSERISDKHGDDICIIGKYNNYSTKIKVVHKKCGNEWLANPGDLLSGNGCPRCNESRGEKRISKYLNNIGVEYTAQYRINECRDKLPLPFDFAIFKNGKLVCLIEYDGEQHFIPANCWGGKKSMLEIQRRDLIKREYCKDKGIRLLEIPYWRIDEIEEMLNEELLTVKEGVIN